MIELKVAQYCHSCPYFEAKQDTIASCDQRNGNICYTNTTIYCENSGKCRLIAKYLLERIKGGSGMKQDELKMYLDRINNGGDTYPSDVKEVEK